MASKSKKLYEILSKSHEESRITWYNTEGQCAFCKEKTINNRFRFGIKAGGELLGKNLIGECVVPICITNWCILNKLINKISLDIPAIIYFKELNVQKTYIISYQNFLDDFNKIFRLRSVEKYKPILIGDKRLKDISEINGTMIYNLEENIHYMTYRKTGEKDNKKIENKVIEELIEKPIKKFIKVYHEVKLN